MLINEVSQAMREWIFHKFHFESRRPNVFNVMTLKFFRCTGGTAEKGFTLLEVLISLTIVALTVTVYFQLISSGMKLEHRSGQKVEAAIRAQQIFEELKTRDVREDEFPWEGEDRKCTWQLQIRPRDVQTLEMEEENPSLKKETELYIYVFRYACPEDKEIVLHRLVVVSPNFFSDQFKKEHMDL